MSKLTRCCYEVTRRSLGVNGDTHRRAQYRQQVFSLAYSCKFLWMAYVMYSGNDGTGEDRCDVVSFQWYLQLDPLLSLLCTKHYNFFVPLSLWLLEVFLFASVHRLTSIDVHSVTARWWYELIVTNQDLYHRCRFAPRRVHLLYDRQWRELRTRLENWCWLAASVARIEWPLKVLARALVCFRMENIHRKRFFAVPFTNLPRLSHRIRRLVMVTSLASDLLVCLIQLTFALICLVFLVLNLVDLWLPPFHPVLKMIALLEVLGIWYNFHQLVQMVMLFALCSVLALLYPAHLRDQVRRLIIPPGKSVGSNRTTRYHSDHRRHLWHFVHEHHRITWLVLHGSRELFSSVLFVFVLTDLPMHVYAMSKLWARWASDDSLWSRVVLGALLYSNTIAAVVVLVPLAYECAHYHRPVRWLGAQTLRVSGRSNLTLKLKLDQLMHRLTTGPRIGVAVGPLVPAVSYATIFEFILLYLGYLLVLSSLQIRKNMY